jgi:hypothetical protein
MAGDPITAGLTLAEKLFSFFTGAKWDEIRKRKRLEAKRAECHAALVEHRFADLRRLTDELERLSTEA